MTGDIINALFEAGAVIALAFHIRAIRRAKQFVGASIVPIAFYAAWGAWNLVYYPSLGQTWSTVAGVGVFSMNLIHLVFIAYYRAYPGGRSLRGDAD